MLDLFNLIKPEVPGLDAIQRVFNQLSLDEQNTIEQRVNLVFSSGMPLVVKADKILYIHLFSMLLQLEVIALEIPLRFGPQMKSQDFREKMRVQLVDEVFHCVLFAKILNQLCIPHAYFPEPNLEMEAARLFIFAEEDPNVALVLLNLIGESWTELLFSMLAESQLAPELFSIVIQDEKRHISEALIYSQTHQISLDLLSQKCHQFEPLMLNLFQYHVLIMAEKLCGIDAVERLVIALDHEYTKQMHNININPGPNWKRGIKLLNSFISQISPMFRAIKPLPITPLRHAQMVMWSTPTEATMAGQYTVDVSDLDLFAKKFPPETLTSLMIQTTSAVIERQAEFRNFLSFNQMYQYQGGALVGIVVKLPGCGDQLGTIVFEDAHLMDIVSVSQHIRHVMKAMVYCYHQARKLESLYPELLVYQQDWLKRLKDPFYPYPIPTGHFVSLSNIAMTGLYTGASPLMKNEAVKLTLLRVEKKSVWDPKKSVFVTKDLLPVCISADHRVFDANWPIQSYFQEGFEEVFNRMQGVSGRQYPSIDILETIQKITQEIKEFPILQYQCFSMLQTLWPSYLSNVEADSFEKFKLELEQGIS